MAKVLIGCETSGVVREAFLALGHDAWSCDLLPSDTPTNRHIQGDVLDVMQGDWDLMAVMHPSCTRLCNSGVRWLSKPPTGRSLQDMWSELDTGAALFSAVWNVSHIPCVAVENPVMHKHAKARIQNYQPPAQTVQPWQFATDPDGPDNERKRTCFWLRNLPLLKATGTLDGTSSRDSVHKASPGAERWKLRSKFFPGIAAAMADQWGYHASRLRQVAQIRNRPLNGETQCPPSPLKPLQIGGASVLPLFATCASKGASAIFGLGACTVFQQKS